MWLEDGRRLLFCHQGRLNILDTVTGAVSEILSLLPYEFHWIFDITRDNRTIFFALVAREADVWLMNLA
jgi:hypothetical protein